MSAPEEDWAALDRALGDFAASGCVEVREDGQWLAELASLQCEINRKGKQALVHLWSEERNLTRRVLRVKECAEDRIVLEVQRFGRAKPGRLELLRTDSPRAAGRITREQFRARFERILKERFPDAVVDSLTAAPDLEHSFSGLYVRGVMHEGSRAWGVLAVSASEDAAAVEGILAYGILWLDWLRSHVQQRAIEALRLFVPQGGSRCLRERLLALSTAARTEIYEVREPDGMIQKIDSADAGNLESWLTPRREVESNLRAAADTIADVRAMLPDASNAIELRVMAGKDELGLSFRGLVFARYTKQGLFFGLGNAPERLTTATKPRLARLLHQLDLHRNSLAEDANHYLYRAAPERWLESIVLEDPAKLDAQLDADHFYSQVPALAAGDRGVLDLLGITRKGRLVVIELKASEDIQLPVQAVDYWLRVRRHQREGDFQEYGYFVGVQIDPRPPLVWLVAPGLRFHSATEILLKYLSSGIQVTRIGLSENWRRGLKIVFRQQ
ncbi:MAG: hypothetical protein WAL95_02430 [Candidatus Acidiferrales bacterium]